MEPENGQKVLSGPPTIDPIEVAIHENIKLFPGKNLNKINAS